MNDKPTYDELEQKNRELEGELAHHKKNSALFECIFSSNYDSAVFADSHSRIVFSNPALSRIFASETVGTVVKDIDGKVLGSLDIMRDISKRKTAEKALWKAHEVLEQRVQQRTDELTKERDKAQKYLDIAGAIIVVFDKNENVTLINRKGAVVLGYTEKEIIGKNWFDIFIPEHEIASAKAEFLRLIDGKARSLKSSANIIVTRDGQELLIEWHNTVLRDMQGDITDILSSGIDITDRKKVEIALQESAEKTKRFAYSVFHDLKNPAIGLTGLIRHLNKKYADLFDEKGKMWCRQIMTTSEQINLLVENVNCLITTTETPLRFEEANLEEICGNIREEFSSQFTDLEIIWSVPEPAPIIKIERLTITRVLRNFIDNALKYGGDNLTTIEIGYLDSGDSHIISVRDDGNGFNDEEREVIFQTFYRNAKPGIAGTGLGLAIVKEIAEKHGGKAWAEPGMEGGATFYISISKNFNESSEPSDASTNNVTGDRARDVQTALNTDGTGMPNSSANEPGERNKVRSLEQQ